MTTDPYMTEYQYLINERLGMMSEDREPSTDQMNAAKAVALEMVRGIREMDEKDEKDKRDRIDGNDRTDRPPVQETLFEVPKRQVYF